MSQLVGAIPEHGHREALGSLTDAERKTLENDAACRKVSPKRDWRGNIVEGEPSEPVSGLVDEPEEPAVDQPAPEFDPADHTVAEVEAFLAENPELADKVLEMERQGKARVSLVGNDPSEDPE